MKFETQPQQVLWFRDKYRAGSLVLKPPFQRKPVWVAKQKCFLIESILLEVPIPEVFVQQTIVDGEASFAVVDGQQRIRAVLQFLGLETEESEAEFTGFSLDKLPSASPYRGFTFEQLNNDDRNKILKYAFSVRMLDVEDDSILRDLFIRLNKYLAKLTDQELRNAMYTGPFVAASVDLADSDYWFEQRLVTAAQIRRMKDVEFVSDLLIGVMHGPQGGSAKVIDEYYARFEDYEDEFPNQRRVVKRFQSALATAQDLFPRLVDTRWQNRTDFYTLFVAIAALQMDSDLPPKSVPAARTALQKLGSAVDQRLADESFRATNDVISYVRAVEKGANDKKRRADRHAVVHGLLSKYFKSRSKRSS
ncbi:MAG TPA: DUF262 domain-containing protein [Vicinamibacterales bacterium]